MKTVILSILDTLFTGNERILDLLEIVIEDNSRFFAAIFEIALIAVIALLIHMKNQAAAIAETAAATPATFPVVLQTGVPPQAPAPAPLIPMWLKCIGGGFLFLLFIGLLPV